MRILFIYPGYENIGIEYLSSVLKKHGHEVSLILDPVLFAESGSINVRWLSSPFDYSKSILKDISQLRPHLICISCVSDNFGWAVRTSEAIKKNFGIPIVFGGIHPTSVPDKVIMHNCVDYLCVGEGENAIIELARMIEGRERPFGIKNIWFKEEGNVIAGETADLIEDLDSLPFPDKDLYYQRYRFMFGGYSILTSRGCPHSCSYCANSILKKLYKGKGRYLRRRSIDNVMEELKQAKDKYRPQFVEFRDEVFTYDKEWLKKFIPYYKESIDLPFTCWASPSFVDEETAALVKEGGCFKVQMGVQTLEEEKRSSLLNRHYSNEQVAQAIRIFKKHKIYLTCDNIFGLPGQNEEELIRMSDFYSRNKPNHIEVYWLRYYPRTEIIDTAQKMGIVDESKKESIEKSLEVKGFARGGDTYNKGFARLQLLLNLFHFMPHSLRRFMLKAKAYKLLPALSPMFITVFFRIFNRAKFDLYTTSTFRRYWHFIGEKFLHFSS